MTFTHKIVLWVTVKLDYCINTPTKQSTLPTVPGWRTCQPGTTAGYDPTNVLRSGIFCTSQSFCTMLFSQLEYVWVWMGVAWDVGEKFVHIHTVCFGCLLFLLVYEKCCVLWVQCKGSFLSLRYEQIPWCSLLMLAYLFCFFIWCIMCYKNGHCHHHAVHPIGSGEKKHSKTPL